MTSILDLVIEKYESVTPKRRVEIKNKATVEHLILQIYGKGPSCLQIVTDFDGTLTRYFGEDGKVCYSSYDVIDRNSLMSEEFRKNVKSDYKTFAPKERDASLTLEEKVAFIIKWYKSYEKHIVAEKISNQTIKDLVHSSQAVLRDGTKKMLNLMNQFSIPVLVFSAGLGDIIEKILIREQVFLSNLKIISNFLKFETEKNDCAVGFLPPVVHVFNKDESIFQNSQLDSYFADLRHRTNAIVLGDSVGDAGMANGMENPGCILKIGFLHQINEIEFEKFKNHFDIVIIEDQTMDFVNILLDQLLSHPGYKKQ